MTLLDSKTYVSDIKKVSKLLEWLELPPNKTFFITGATGLICSAVVDVLEELSVSKNLNWTIFVAVRNLDTAKQRFSKYNSNIVYFAYDILKPSSFPENIDYFIHGAGNAYPSVISKYPVETLTGSIYGLEQILHYAVEHKNTRVLYVSSSEVYGVLETNKPIKENEYGFVDILNPRSSYSIGKRAAESLCSSFISEFNADCVIVRPGHIYGPTASKQDNRVSSAFMYSAAQGQNLVMKSKGEQIRSYCYCLDCASAIIVSLFLGETGEAYNISNKNSLCTINEMAEYFAKVGNVKLCFDLPSEREKNAFNPMLNSSLSSEKLESLGWEEFFSKEEGFEHSVAIIKELLKNA